MSSPKNQAAWIEAANAHPFVIKDAKYPMPEPHEVVIQTRAVAANLIDLKLQAHAVMPLEYPTILGYDAAGDVVEVGTAVQGFKKGDRVISQCISLITNKPEHAAYQKFVACSSATTAVMPNLMSYEQAVVLPTCFSTAGMALFQKEYLGLEMPAFSSTSKNQVVFIWGGSGGVGSNAIQLAKAAGYNVAVTASAKNFTYCKELGADHVFDHNKTDVEDEIISALKGKTIVGAFDTISEDTLKITVKIMESLVGKSKVASAHPFTEKYSTANVEVGGVIGATFGNSGIGAAVWRDFLPKALESGKFLPKPDPVVVGKGLENVQLAVDKLKQPLSAQKLVVTI